MLDNSLWRGRHVLVTGCTGFLGSTVTHELLARGAIVAGLVRDRSRAALFAPECRTRQFRVVHGRVEDAIHLHTAMAVHEVSAVFHLASADPFGTDRGSGAVMRAAALYHSKVPVVTARPAGQLRLSCEEESAAVPLGIARFGELFGGGDQKVFRVVPRTILEHLDGDSATQASPGTARDFVFVRDAARACLTVAEAAGAGGRSLDATFRTGWEFTERSMAEQVAVVVAGKSPNLPATELPPNPLGWQPAETFAAALSETVAWYRESQRVEFPRMLPFRGRKAA